MERALLVQELAAAAARRCPTAGKDVVAGIGEQAGVIAIGDGLAVAFKIESHNHPSAVEPYQGAATGVGGILRDVFAMGARPIAVLDALRFGDPSDARTRHLVDGVVRGVGGYGNCVGVPTVGGELVFDPSYQGNPLVNVMAIGLLEEGMLTRASADGPGNLVVLYGSATGRDGIGGASVLASATFGDQDPSKRPSVQVGDPFAEKLLIEATLELIAKGLVVSIQDLGAAGITCATCETADRGGTGMLVDLDAIPRREPGMEPFEVMISESQERMVAIVEPGRWEAVRAVCERWDLPVAVIGRVTEEPDIVVLTGPDGAGALDPDGGRSPARRSSPGSRPAPSPREAIVFERESRAPARRRAAPAPGAADGAGRHAPAARPGPGRRAHRAPRLGEPVVAPRGVRAVRLERPVQHRRGPGPRRRRAPDQGHDEGARRHDRRQRPGRPARPVAGRRDVGRRGRPQRVDHRRAAAGRDELPQLRRPDPAGGVLAARRGRPRPVRRVRRPRACRSPAATSRCTTRRPARAIAPTPEIGIVGLLDDVATRVGPAFRAEGNAVAHGRRHGARARRLGVRAARRRRARGRPAAARPRPRDRRPGVHPRGDRARPRRELPGRVGRRPRGRARRDGDLGRRRARRCASASATRRPSRCSARARRGSSSRSSRATSRRSSCSPASTGSRSTPSARPAARGSSSSSPATAPPGAAEERGSRIADALEVPLADLRHAWDHGLPRALGWEGDGGADHVADAALPGTEVRA